MSDVCGGYKIVILNYTKPGEFKYQIYGTEGLKFATNDRLRFLEKIKEIF